MAKRRRNRDDNSIASEYSLVRLPRSMVYVPGLDQYAYYNPPPLPVDEDLRRWDPEGLAAPIRSQRGYAKMRELYHATRFVGSMGYSGRFNVMHCLRRKVRREVLHALKLKRSGRGSGKRRTWRSDIKC